MVERKITLSLPIDLFEEVSSMCGKRKEYSSKQEFLYELVVNHLKTKEISVETTDMKKKESNSLEDRFFSEGE